MTTAGDTRTEQDPDLDEPSSESQDVAEQPGNGQEPAGDGQQAAEEPDEDVHEEVAESEEAEEAPYEPVAQVTAMEAAKAAEEQLVGLTGREPDAIVGLQAIEEGWRVTLDLVEIARIPPATDLLGTYEVTLDLEGGLLGYERLRRHVRGQAGEDQA